MEELKSIEKCLISQVQAQCGDLKKVNAKELGEVMDMIKDLEEAMYYCSIIEAMEKSAEEKQNMNINYYMEGDAGRNYYGGRMYYDGQSSNSSQSNSNSTSGNDSGMSGRKTYVPYMEYAPYMMRDDKWRQDRSSTSRRMYMESKHEHKDNQQSMRELERYIYDLGEDLVDMVKESTPEEKQVLINKIQQLTSKIR